MIIVILLLAAGVLCGRLLGDGAYAVAGEATQYILYALLALVGFELGGRSGIFAQVKNRWRHAVAVPLAAALGSVAGGVLAGLLLGMELWQSAAVSAGYGWYSLSSLILAEIDAPLGAMAFLSNVLREVIAIVSIPLLTKKLSPWAGIAAGGATAMDVTLPLVTRSAGVEYSPFAFLSGAALSALVPVTLTIIFSIAGVQ
ncbi:MAG: lysine exporter LysO family protein [Eubacteriales bacterium]|nr:lysine exporter LysO family protein [Eubacteriales bacterium]